MNELFLSIQCNKFDCKTVYGSDDAALTSIISGGLWALKSIMVNKLKNRIHLVNKPLINVTPLFNQQKFELDFTCIFSIRLGNVINATIKLLNYQR
jgi:hypothetical protein